MSANDNNLNKRRDLAAYQYSLHETARYDFMQGWNAALKAMQEIASASFNADDAMNETGDDVDTHISVTFVQGARWQHSQDMALVAAKDAQIEALKKLVTEEDDAEDILIRTIVADEDWVELERASVRAKDDRIAELEEALKFYADENNWRNYATVVLEDNGTLAREVFGGKKY